MKKLILALCFLMNTTLLIIGQTTIVDFEQPTTSPSFTYFGSTLDQTTTNIIPNPDATGINTTDFVSDFTKPASAEVWAGAFADGANHSAIDLTTDAEICVDVWFASPGNLALKLENSSNSFENWIDQQEVSTTNEWVQVCFSALSTSFEAPFEAAFGGVFNGLVLFFDFGEVPTADRSYFFDNVIVRPSNASPADVTFTVNMSAFQELFTTVYVSGTFNDWSVSENPMFDNGDGTWTGVVQDINPGNHEYKFQVDQFNFEENFSGGESCTILNQSNSIIARRLVVTEDIILDPVCYESCFNCGEAVKLTINLGDAGLTVSDDGFYIAGGANFGVPGDNKLTDPDGDGIHSITFEKEIGFESFYTFTNGICPDFSCKEDIAGQDCANPDDFNDRFLGPLMEDTVINTCFAQCTTTTDCEDANEGNILFMVDMSDYTEAFTQVYLSGTFNNWSSNLMPLTDEGAGIWSIDVPLLFGDYQYKFQLDEWAAEETFAIEEACNVSDGTFINRALTVDGNGTLCFQWQSCSNCEGVATTNLSVDENLFTVRPTLVSSNTQLTFDNSQSLDKKIMVMDAVGNIIIDVNLPSNVESYTLDLNSHATSVYFINVSTSNRHLTKKVFKINYLQN